MLSQHALAGWSGWCCLALLVIRVLAMRKATGGEVRGAIRVRVITVG